MDVLPGSAVAAFLSNCAARAAEDRQDGIAFHTRVTRATDDPYDTWLSRLAEIPDMFLIDTDSRAKLGIQQTIWQAGDRCRLEAPDGSPREISDGRTRWKFCYPGDSLYVATDPEPVPYRAPRMEPVYSLFAAPPLLPTELVRPGAHEPAVTVGEATASEQDGRPVWTFSITQHMNRDPASLPAVTYTVSVERETGYLVVYEPGDPAYAWHWDPVVRGADVDPDLFTWTGPDRSIDEALALR